MSGLIGWWPLNEDSGSTAYDLSGNENHGSLNGGVTQGVSGKGGLTSHSFDGNDSVIQVSGDIVSQSGNSHTVSGWFKTPDSSTRKDIFHSKPNDAGYVDVRISINKKGDRKLLYELARSSDNAVSEIKSQFQIENSEWYFFCAVYDENGTQRLYVNGNLVSSTSFSWSEKVADLSIGANSGVSVVHDGSLSDIRVYDRAITPEEVQELYEWGSGDFARPLNDQNSSSAVSRWTFDGDATDSWASNDGNVVNGANFVSDSIRNKAISFDGSNYVDLGSSVFPSGAKTLAVWFKYKDGGLASESGGDAYLLEQEDSNGDLQSLYYNDDTEIIFLNSGKIEVQESRTISPDVWNFVAYTYDGSKSRLYFNGSLVDEGSGSDTDNANNTGLGTKRLGGGLWQGKIDDVRIYDKALSPSEVFELYRWGTRGRDIRKQLVNKR